MSAIYNSQLISKLYKAGNLSEIEGILEEMAEIKDSVFIQPIFDAYQRLSHESFSHYFISVLNTFQEKEILEILKAIVNNSSTSRTDVVWTIPGLLERKIFDPAIVNRIVGYLISSTESDLDRYELEDILKYLKAANVLPRYDYVVRNIFVDEQYDRNSRRVALNFLLNINPTESFDTLIQNYVKFKNKETENLIAREVLRWHGKKVEELKDKIINEGSDRAKEIILQAQKKAELQKVKQQEIIAREQKNLYANAPIIYQINELLRKINVETSGHQNIGFELLSGGHFLPDQLQIASDRSSLESYCSKLRACIIEISPKINQHGLSEDQISQLLPDVTEEDASKSLNQLYLYLHSRGITVEQSVFGLKQLYRATGLVSAHPEVNKETLLRALVKINASEFYRAEDWAILHQHLLKQYKICLEKMHDALRR